MEMRSFIHYRTLCYIISNIVLLLLCPALLSAQPPQKKYTFSHGSMQIILSKDLDEKELDQFIEQYDVADLALKQMIKLNFTDSINKQGWKIEVNSKNLLIISKALMSADNIGDGSGRLKVTVNTTTKSGNPIPLNNQRYGINNFRKQLPFAIKDSIVIFTLDGKTDVKEVLLAGNFTGWQDGALRMNKTTGGWQLPVKLLPGKYTYKFIVDGNWINDPANAILENDGEGNNNSVFYVTNSIFKLQNFTDARNVFVAGSFANWEDGKLRMYKTAGGWELPVYLDTGTYTYRFLVDRKWMTDPSNNNKLPNEFNDYNSVITIGKPVLFSLTGLPDAKKVYLAGSFNDWRKFELPMAKTANGWEVPYVLGAGNYEYKFYADNKWLDAEGTIVKESAPGSVFVIEPNYAFRFKNSTAEKVFLAGDFNGWSPDAYAMKKEGDEWVMPVHLSAGKHLYKFVVDGKWIIDPGNSLWEENEHGTGNSILWVK
ncbi:MAG: hypothetical protein H7Y86_12445 [Rhizobacter sp.]|nr:hypothetical protein [Ferruginibacter sp.]